MLSYFVDALEDLSTQIKAQMKKNFLQIQTAIKSRLARILETLNQRRSHCVGTEAGNYQRSTQFLEMQKNQLIDLQERFEWYCNTIPAFGFSISRYDINLVKSYLLPIVVYERNFEPIVIKKRQSICFVQI